MEVNSARRKTDKTDANYDKVEKRGKEFVMRLVFDPRVGLKRFFNEVINHFSPTRGSNTSRITNSLSLFSILYQTLNFHNWHLFCVFQNNGLMVD